MFLLSILEKILHYIDEMYTICLKIRWEAETDINY